MEVEVSLRVPNMKNRALDENGYPIDHSMFRFRKRLTVPAMPKAGETLSLSTQSGRTLDSVVARSDWHEEKALFVVSCQCSSRSISPDDYAALVGDTEWVLTPLI